MVIEQKAFALSINQKVGLSASKNFVEVESLVEGLEADWIRSHPSMLWVNSQDLRRRINVTWAIQSHRMTVSDMELLIESYLSVWDTSDNPKQYN